MTLGDERRPYLDWLRGVAVLIMIQAHTMDAWTRLGDRGRAGFTFAMVVGGIGAPIFLFLAGVALALAAGKGLRKGRASSDVAARARRRGWQILGLAFLFRLQSRLLSGGGPFPQTLLRVDILNVMGVSMVAAAVLWRLGTRGWSRAALLILGTIAVAVFTPAIRASSTLAVLPDPIEWYLRPAVGRTTFTLFPWGGFLLAGAVVGLLLDRSRTPDDERRANTWLAAGGVLIAVSAYGASYLPPLHLQSEFWTSSPAFFFVRLGVLVALVPTAYVWTRLWPRRSPVQELGVASLFVYWIHVEMVYGFHTQRLRQSLTLEQVLVAFVLFTAFLYGLVKIRDRVVMTETFARLTRVTKSRWRS